MAMAQSSASACRRRVPLIYQGNLIGLLLVRSDICRVSGTIMNCCCSIRCGSVVVAVNQAHLFAQMQQQALTDGLTGCYNSRS